MYPVVCIGRYEGTERLRGRRERTYSSLPSSSTRRENLKKCLGQPCFRCTSMAGHHVRTWCHVTTERLKKRKKGKGSICVPGSYVSKISQGSQQRFPRRHLCTNSKKPKYNGKWSCEMPDAGAATISAVPKAFHGVDVHFMKAITVLIPSIFATAVTDTACA